MWEGPQAVSKLQLYPDPIAFTDSFEDKLRERLFEQEIAEIQKEEEEKINNPDFERSGYSPKVEKKPGL